MQDQVRSSETMRHIRSLHQTYPGDGPRYTSYPTALELSPSFGVDDALSLIRLSNEALVPNPLSLYFHLPFCRHLCFYCGCNRIVTKNEARASAYLEALIRETRLVGSCIDGDREVVQLHFGGGTPSFYSISQLRKLLGSIGDSFRLSEAPDRDFSIEIDPRTVDEAYLHQLTDLGFNRISIGVQDFDQSVQDAIHRCQDGEHIERLVTAARRSGVGSINFDLVYGLPKQTVKTCKETLERTIRISPDRVSIYQYAHMPQRFPAQRRIKSDDLPDRNLRFDLECATIEVLADAGYQHIGMDHYARPGDPLAKALRQGTIYRNFMGYSTHADCDLIGFGVSATSDIGGGLYQNAKMLDAYYAKLDQGGLAVALGLSRDSDDLIRQSVIRGIMCEGEIHLGKFSVRVGVEFEDYFRSEWQALERMARDGLLDAREDAVNVTRLGRFLLRDIARVFDRYRKSQNKHQSPVELSSVRQAAGSVVTQA